MELLAIPHSGTCPSFGRKNFSDFLSVLRERKNQKLANPLEKQRGGGVSPSAELHSLMRRILGNSERGQEDSGTQTGLPN